MTEQSCHSTLIWIKTCHMLHRKTLGTNDDALPLTVVLVLVCLRMLMLIAGS